MYFRHLTKSLAVTMIRLHTTTHTTTTDTANNENKEKSALDLVTMSNKTDAGPPNVLNIIKHGSAQPALRAAARTSR